MATSEENNLGTTEFSANCIFYIIIFKFYEGDKVSFKIYSWEGRLKIFIIYALDCLINCLYNYLFY
jgi:hypothetical protein